MQLKLKEELKKATSDKHSVQFFPLEEPPFELGLVYRFAHGSCSENVQLSNSALKEKSIFFPVHNLGPR